MIQIILGLVAIFMIIKISYNYARKDIQFGEFFLWLIAWIGLLIVSAMPQISTFLAGYVGLSRGIDLIVIVSIIVLFYVIYGLYKKIDRQEKDMTKLVRELTKKK
ncbi:MAG: DUF2304 domain-containing protein [Candidatus Woesearchaeota archaeon]